MSFYSKSLPVYSSNVGQVQKRKTFLTVSATYQPSTSTPASSNSKDFAVQLTCEDNPLFLFTLRISECVFQQLKNEQNLLVDFASFPRMFVDLLDLAEKEDGKSDPKYVLYFTEEGKDNVFYGGEKNSAEGEGGMGTLEIVESNRFKHLVHLSLKLSSASDNQLKKYLSECLQEFKRSFHNLERKSKENESELKRKLHQANESNTKMTMELEKVKTSWSEDVKQLKEQHARALVGCQERLEQNHESMKEDKSKVLSRLKSLEAENKKLREELEGKGEMLEKLSRENRNMLENCHEWETRFNEIERELEEIPLLQRDIEDLRIDLKSREDDLKRAREKLKSVWQSKKELEKVWEEKCGELEDERREKEKSLEVIKKMLNQNKAVKDKAKQNTELLTEQEKHVKSIEEELRKVKEELAETNKKVTSFDEEKSKFTEEMKGMSEKVVKAEQQASSKDALITYLTKQLNELKFGPVHPPIPTGPLSYRPVLGLGMNHNSAVTTSTPYVGGGVDLSRARKSVNFGISPIPNFTGKENLPSGSRGPISATQNQEPNLPKPS